MACIVYIRVTANRGFFFSQEHVFLDIEEMTFKAAPTTVPVATAVTTRRRRAGGFARMAAFLLVAAVVLADVIRTCE